MTRCCTNHSSRGGFTLVELLVTVMILAVVVTGLCDVFIANQKAWDRQSSQSTALTATDAAMSAIGSYASKAMDRRIYSRFSTGDVLVVCLPSDTAYGMYVPSCTDNWGHPVDLQYNHGQGIVFYLSDSTGSYGRTGSILWAGTVSFWQTPSVFNVTPDSSWSLYPGSSRGRIAPISSIRFGTSGAQRYTGVDVTVNATYEAGAGTADLTRTRTICLRSQMY
jgi:prepilin-type N-terminal cleavage/methylation domain-containing protein